MTISQLNKQDTVKDFIFSDNTFSIILKQLRLEHNISQAQLGNEIGVSQGTIYFWENGINEPTATNLIALSNFFNVSVDCLLGLEDANKYNKLDCLEILQSYNSLSKNQQKLILVMIKEILNLNLK